MRASVLSIRFPLDDDDGDVFTVIAVIAITTRCWNESSTKCVCVCFC